MKRSQASYGQVGQDLWVIGEVFNGRRGGYFVDVGADDGIAISNTFLLEAQYGWTGVCVEARREAFELLQANRPKSQCCNVAVDAKSRLVQMAIDGPCSGIVGADNDQETIKECGLSVVEVQAEPLADILDRAQAPPVIQYLSMDIEGAEERALIGFPFDKYTFQAMTIERPGGALIEWLGKNGYRPVRMVPGLDVFFLHQSMMGSARERAIEFWTSNRLWIEG